MLLRTILLVSVLFIRISTKARDKTLISISITYGKGL
jgi:hypothetical protein